MMLLYRVHIFTHLPQSVTLILSDKLPSFPTSSDRSPTPTPVAPTFVGAGRDIPSQGIALPDLPSSEAPFPDFPSSDAPLAKRAKSDSQESSGSGAFVAEEVRWSGLNSFSLEEDVVMMSSSEGEYILSRRSYLTLTVLTSWSTTQFNCTCLQSSSTIRRTAHIYPR
jgi:hypothetical protein